ncbi:unnamed protein product, partial [Callosobruchus maculatus]
NDKNAAKVSCEFCKGTAVFARVKCANCLQFYHNSCAEKAVQKCCEKQQLLSGKSDEMVSDLHTVADDDITGIPSPENLRTENTLLKKLVNELETDNVAEP